VDTKRKEERERRKERLEDARREALEDTRRLQNLKRAEIRAQVEKIGAQAGFLGGGGGNTGSRNGGREGKGLPADIEGMIGEELEGEWDPAEHDRRMALLFGDEYYGEVEAEEVEDGGAVKKSKPGWIFGEGARPDWAGPSADDLAMGVDDGLGEVMGDDDDDDDEGMGVEGVWGETGSDLMDPALVGSKRARKLRKRAARAKVRGQTSVMARARAELRRVISGGTGEGGGEEEDPEEVLAMGVEDVIAGGLKTRFKYVPVPAMNFGLSAEELLLADDEDLALLAPLKHLAPYRDPNKRVGTKHRSAVVKSIKEKVAALREAAHAEKPNVLGGGSWKKGSSESRQTATEEKEVVQEEEEEEEEEEQEDEREEKEEEEGEGHEDTGEKKKKKNRRKGKSGASKAGEDRAVDIKKEEKKKKRRRQQETSEGVAESLTLPGGTVLDKNRLSSYGF